MSGQPIPIMCICGHSFAVPANRAGQRVPCPACARVLTVPEVARVGATQRQSAPSYGDPRYQADYDVTTRVSASNQAQQSWADDDYGPMPPRRSRMPKRKRSTSPMMPIITLSLFFLILGAMIFVIMKLNQKLPIGHSINVVTHIDPNTGRLRMTGHNRVLEGRDMSMTEGAVLIIEMKAVKLNDVEYRRGAVLVVFNENPLQLRMASPIDNIILPAPLTFAGSVLQPGPLNLRADGHLQQASPPTQDQSTSAE